MNQPPSNLHFPKGFYLSDRLMGERDQIAAMTFLQREYIEQGAALFGRETRESLNDFRVAIGGSLDRADDAEVYEIICFGVMRLKAVAKLLSMRLGRYKYGRIHHCKDREPLCQFLAGKFFRVKVVLENLETFAQLSMEEQGSILKTACRRAVDSRFVDDLQNHKDDLRIVPEFLILECLGIPPFHRRCGCIAEAVDKEEADGPSSPSNRPKVAVPFTITIKPGGSK